MLFHSLSFFIFFPITVLVYYLIPHKLRNYWLLAASYYFYMSWNVKYVVLLLFSTIITWVGGLVLCKYERLRVPTMVLCIGSNLSLLFLFKYLNFTFDTLSHLASRFGMSVSLPHSWLLLPVGISFYTFQALGYLIDVYRGDIAPEQNPFKYALFVSFFPQLVAGPIERSQNLLPQFDEIHIFNLKEAEKGFLTMAYGFFLKLVIADRIAIFVDTVYASPDSYPGWFLITATILFSIQIYCDFAGYSTIAIGAARILGFRLMQNFDAPYFSVSVSEFWRRWHISLSGWFRDYVYIPLGGNRKGPVHKYVNLMITFLVSGLWHGADWSYVIWGGLNGLYQVISDLFHRATGIHPGKNKVSGTHPIFEKSANIVKCIMTFLLIDLSWLFFRAPSVSSAFELLRSCLHADNFAIFTNGELYSAGIGSRAYVVLLIALLILFVADLLRKKEINPLERFLLLPYPVRAALSMMLILFTVICGVWGRGYDSENFIYFQF